MNALPVAGPDVVRRAARQLIADDRRGMAVVVALHALAAAAGLAAPALLGRIVDRVEQGGSVDTLAAATVAFAAAQLVLTRFARLAGLRFGERALARLRERFVDRVLTLPIAAVERAGTGELVTRSTGDVTTVGATVRDAAPDLLIGIVQVTFTLVAFVVLDPVLAVCAFAGLGALPVVTRWYLRRARSAYLEAGTAHAEMTESLAATTAGARTVEAYRLHEHRIGVGDGAVERMLCTGLATLRLRSVLFPVCDASYAVPVALVLLVGGLLIDAGAVGLGSVVAAALYAVQLVDPLDRILLRVEQLQAGGAALARVLGVEEVPVAEPRPALPRDDTVEAIALRFAYDATARNVLDDVTLTVAPGERLAIVGPSGAGKSTLGRLLAGLDRPSGGSVTVGGVPVADLPVDERRHRVLLVAQEQHVFLGTLRENLAVAAPDATDADLSAALDAVDARWVADLPAGLDTALGAAHTPLGPAAAQHVALARVVLADPRVVVLDEATAVLDPAAARHTERRLSAVLHGRTVIAIAHRLHTARDADRIVVLGRGRITERGTHDALVTADGTYASLWRSWQGGPGLQG
ncbi:ABC transporter ATP-binding protein [Pseudonocardia nigra]|uniref:ABC transporter ATP-binding protein n=1 Tax=Pseudonocardia nigra TaxID=1921578 RepID=UPI0027E258CE|nr:ABC transporter ATP-binding protein [Pseudonocardia nigra]